MNATISNTQTEAEQRVDTLRNAVIISPDDLATRSAYADALEENGQSESAEQRQILARKRRRFAHIEMTTRKPGYVVSLWTGRTESLKSDRLVEEYYDGHTAGSTERLRRGQALRNLDDWARLHGWTIAANEHGGTE